MASGAIASLGVSTNSPYSIFPRADYDRVAITSRAALLVGSPEPSERLIVVAQYQAQDRSLASVVEFVGPDTERTRIAPSGDVHSFPPADLLITTNNVQRLEDGITWATDRGTKIAVATDGSVALRIRLANDRQGKGGARQRGEVGLFTTLEQLIGAILYARKLATKAASTTDFCFRLELYPSTARLMCEPPSFVVDKHRLVSGVELDDMWPRLTEQVSLPIRVAGRITAEAGSKQLAALLDEIAHTIAVFFGVENLVAALHPGAVTASIFENFR